MSSDERSPAKSECLEEEPEVYRVESAGVVPSGNIGIEKIIEAILVVMLENSLCGTFYAVGFGVLIAVFLIDIFERKEFIGLVTEYFSCLFLKIFIVFSHDISFVFPAIIGT